MAVAAERQADALEAILGLLQERLPVAKPTPKRERVTPRVEPEAAPPQPVGMDPSVEAVWMVLDRLSRVNAGKTRKAVRPVLPAAVIQAMQDHDDRDHLQVAKDYAAWQEHSARSPHTDVVAGFRNQLKMAPAVAKPLASDGPRPGMDRLLSDEALEEALR